ncbi:MAG TPA: PxKF domain-containing protein [Gaiella sp.]|nr:PxKF domain-containing protein [Gaiella sp.]
MASQKRVRAGGRVSFLVGTFAMALLFAALAYADDISNTLDPTIDASFEAMALNVGGSTGSTTLIVTPRNGDGKNGCNLTGSTTLSVSVASSNTAVVAVSPTSLTFMSCGDVKTLMVTPVATGTANVTLSQTSNNTGGTFNFVPASFTVSVAPPPNTAPVVQVTGVTHGSSYDHGNVPVAGCLVSDTEDGLSNSTSAATSTLSPFSGPYAADGIGAQTARCSYTDGGGLTQTVEATYTVTDPSAPQITPSLVGTLGLNGWYRSDVTLTWLVQEPQSPTSLAKTGCDPQSITVDQAATPYGCSATSVGGSSGPVSVVIKRDASAPTVTGAPSTSANAAGWYKAAVTLSWTCADVGPSGLLDSCPATTVLSAEGRTQAGTLGPISDNAGNTTTGTSNPAVDIDMTPPTVSAATAATSINVSGTEWYKDSVTFQWTANDPALADGSAGSGANAAVPASSTFNTTGVGHSATASASDLAGNTGTGDLTGVNVDASNPSVALVCPTTAMLGGVAAATWSASDTGSGLATAASGAITLETDTVGTKTVTAPTASDNVGHTSAVVSCQYRVVYGFAGLFAPIDRPNTMNVSKAGQSIPLKWRLTDADGNPVLDLDTAAVTVNGINCSLGASDDLVEEVAPGGSGLQNLGDGYYQINWKTPTSYAGSCKTLNLNLGEGAPRTALAYISFKK